MRAVLLALAPLVVGAQALEYQVVTTAGPRPSARFDGTIVYDPPGNQLGILGAEIEDHDRRVAIGFTDGWGTHVRPGQWLHPRSRS